MIMTLIGSAFWRPGVSHFGGLGSKIPLLLKAEISCGLAALESLRISLNKPWARSPHSLKASGKA